MGSEVITNKQTKNNLSPAEINALGIQALRQQPIQEHIVGTYKFTAGETQQIKIPNLGILAGVMLRVVGSWQTPDITKPLTPVVGSHISKIFKEINYKFSDNSTRHQGSAGFHIHQVLERYKAFLGYTPISTLIAAANIYDKTDKFVTADAGVNYSFEGLFYVPCEIPAGGMFEGGYNLTDPSRGNADNFIRLSLASMDDIHAGTTLKPTFGLFETTAASVTQTNLDIEVTMLYRQPTNVLPVLSLATKYNIDTSDSQTAKQNGQARFELEASGYTYLQVFQQLTDGGYVLKADVEADTHAFTKTQLMLNGANSRYDRAYRTNRNKQKELSPYAYVDCLIHDWREFPLAALTNGSLTIINTINASAYTAPLITTTFERLSK